MMTSGIFTRPEILTKMFITLVFNCTWAITISLHYLARQSPRTCRSCFSSTGVKQANVSPVVSSLLVWELQSEDGKMVAGSGNVLQRKRVLVYQTGHQGHRSAFLSHGPTQKSRAFLLVSFISAMLTDNRAYTCCVL